MPGRITRTGGCACGSVRFEARGEPWRVGICHCLTCRKVHGAPFGVFAIYAVEAVSLVGATGTYRSVEGGPRQFCRRCGSPVFGRDPEGDEVELPLGAFDEPNTLPAPTYELFMGRRETWLGDLPSVTRHYPGNRPPGGRSEG